MVQAPCPGFALVRVLCCVVTVLYCAVLVLLCCAVRQALALVFTLRSANPGVQSLLLTLLCSLFAVAHSCPSATRGNTLQAVLLVCLTSLALSGCPAGDAVERSATSTVGTASDTLGRGMQTVFGIVAPVAAVAWAYLGARVPTWLRAARSLSYV